LSNYYLPVFFYIKRLQKIVITKLCFYIHRMELEEYVKRANLAEKEIEALSEELKKLTSQTSNCQEDDVTTQVPEELEKLRVENTKLKYRLGVLQRATAEEVTKTKGSVGKKTTSAVKKTKMNVKINMMNVLKGLEDTFRAAIAVTFPDLPDAPCPINVSAKAGDYQFNGAMAIAGLLKVDNFISLSTQNTFFWC
jgi:regulator of replication initiation timing